MTLFPELVDLALTLAAWGVGTWVGYHLVEYTGFTLGLCLGGALRQRQQEAAVLAAVAELREAEPEGTGGGVSAPPVGTATGAPVEGSRSPRFPAAGEGGEGGGSAGD